MKSFNDARSIDSTGALSATHSDSSCPVNISLEELSNVGNLAQLWMELETRAAASFYLSWLWIGTWLDHLPKTARAFLMIGRRGGRIVALAVLCRKRIWSVGPHRHRWFLHQTGNALHDRLYMEYNGILVDRSEAGTVTAECLNWLMHRFGDYDDFALSGIEVEFELAVRRVARDVGRTIEVLQPDFARWVDFGKVRQNGGNYRTMLGRNTRQAVNRAARLYGERGPVEFRVMHTVSEALAALDLMDVLHKRRWGRSGSFANPSFRPFHEDLISRGMPVGAVRISRTLVGGETVGILYNFVHDGYVLNYQNGFVFEPDSRLKPGLVSHVLAIEDSFARDERGYDFLATPAGHKTQLANAERAMNSISVSSDNAHHRIETNLWKAKRALVRVSKAAKRAMKLRLAGFARHR